MQFTYANRGVPTAEEAVVQALRATYVLGTAEDIITSGLNNNPVIRDIADELLDELRTILTGEIRTLFDNEGIAEEWNDAIHHAIRVVDGDLP